MRGSSTFDVAGIARAISASKRSRRRRYPRGLSRHVRGGGRQRDRLRCSPCRRSAFAARANSRLDQVNVKRSGTSDATVARAIARRRPATAADQVRPCRPFIIEVSSPPRSDRLRYYGTRQLVDQLGPWGEVGSGATPWIAAGQSSESPDCRARPHGPRKSAKHEGARHQLNDIAPSRARSLGACLLWSPFERRPSSARR